MAVLYKEIKAKVETTAFTKEELSAIEAIEKVIDKKINSEFDNSPIWFDLNIINFSINPDGGHYNFKDTRARIMMDELKKRYSNAGWQVTTDYIDQRWVLQGK